LEPAELFHQLLEHRYFLSQQRAEGVPTEEALDDFVSNVLVTQPAERQLAEVGLTPPEEPSP
jgi:hypothetical protein